MMKAGRGHYILCRFRFRFRFRFVHKMVLNRNKMVLETEMKHEEFCK